MTRPPAYAHKFFKLKIKKKPNKVSLGKCEHFIGSPSEPPYVISPFAAMDTMQTLLQNFVILLFCRCCAQRNQAADVERERMLHSSITLGMRYLNVNAKHIYFNTSI